MGKEGHRKHFQRRKNIMIEIAVYTLAIGIPALVAVLEMRQQEMAKEYIRIRK